MNQSQKQLSLWVLLLLVLVALGTERATAQAVHLGGFVYALADVEKAGAIARRVRGVSAVTSAIRLQGRPSRA